MYFEHLRVANHSHSHSHDSNGCLRMLSQSRHRIPLLDKPNRDPARPSYFLISILPWHIGVFPHLDRVINWLNYYRRKCYSRPHPLTFFVVSSSSLLTNCAP